jgi:hypothetical protein
MRASIAAWPAAGVRAGQIRYNGIEAEDDTPLEEALPGLLFALRPPFTGVDTSGPRKLSAA